MVMELIRATSPTGGFSFVAGLIPPILGAAGLFFLRTLLRRLTYEPLFFVFE